MLEQADLIIQLAEHLGIKSRLAEGHIIRGWALMELGDESGIPMMSEGLRNWKATGAEKHFVPTHLYLLATGHLRKADLDAGLKLVGEALEIFQDSREHWFESELYRLKGISLLSLGKPNSERAILAFKQSIEVADQQVRHGNPVTCQ